MDSAYRSEGTEVVFSNDSERFMQDSQRGPLNLYLINNVEDITENP